MYKAENMNGRRDIFTVTTDKNNSDPTFFTGIELPSSGLDI